ncbi:MAG: glycosyltransferase family 4 protein [Thermodesulfovibrionales bacterium]
MLTILHTESSTGWGGQEIRILEESLGMLRRGHRVIIVSPDKSNIFKRAEAAGIKVYPADFQKWNLLSFLRISSLIRREGVDILNTHSSSDSWVATLAARLSVNRPRIIRTRHLSTPIGKSLFSHVIYNALPDAIITTGEEIRQRMIRNNGFKAQRIFSIPTGVDLERFDPTRVTPAFKPKGFSIGTIGVLRSWKGHSYLIEAVPEILKSIPDAVFYIVGDGPQYRNIEGHIEKLSLKDKVVMVGHREDIPEVLASLDVVVHPSYANEGVPQSVLQALAMERPVVASDAGAVKEVVIDGKNGFLIQPKKPEEIAEKVIALYKNPELGKLFGKEGRMLVKRSYSFEMMLDKIEYLYGRLVNGRLSLI